MSALFSVSSRFSFTFSGSSRSAIESASRRAEQIKQSGDVIGNRVKLKVVKNKVAPPFKVAEVVDELVSEHLCKYRDVLPRISWHFHDLGRSFRLCMNTLSLNCVK